MTFDIGDRIIYQDSDRDGESITGWIVDIWRNNRDNIVGYFAELDLGVFVHIQPDSLRWCKVDEPITVT